MMPFNTRTGMTAILVMATLYLLNSGLGGLYALMELTQRPFMQKTVPSLAKKTGSLGISVS
ncbi:hypothetical protein GGI05_005200, partial [Coemansia sp. RSA 2603]